MPHTRSRTTPSWRTTLGLVAALSTVLLSFSVTQAALLKREVKVLIPSAPLVEITFQTTETNYINPLPLNTCVSNLTIPANVPYTAITSTDNEVALNFYMDEDCTEYDFSIMSEVREFVGHFASVKYVGQFIDAKPGFYENREFSNTVLPDQDPDGENHQGPVTMPSGGVSRPLPPSGTNGSVLATLASDGAPAVATEDPLQQHQEDEKAQRVGSAGFAVGMGIIGMVVLSGIAFAVFWFVKGKDQYAQGGGVLGRKRHGGGGGAGAFRTLSSGQDDYDEEVGLTGENGPHSSALMQSRVGVSFDDERFPATYRDEDQALSDDEDDDVVELGAYPQNPKGPTQYREEPGTLPQNLPSL